MDTYTCPCGGDLFEEIVTQRLKRTYVLELRGGRYERRLNEEVVEAEDRLEGPYCAGCRRVVDPSL